MQFRDAARKDSISQPRTLRSVGSGRQLKTSGDGIQRVIGGEAMRFMQVMAVMGIVVDVTHCLFLLSNARHPARIALREVPRVG